MENAKPSRAKVTDLELDIAYDFMGRLKTRPEVEDIAQLIADQREEARAEEREEHAAAKEMTKTEVLRHLCDFVGAPEEVATMTPEEVRAALEDEGVDIAAMSDRLHRRLAAIRKGRNSSPPD